jgi:hypothetical protein
VELFQTKNKDLTEELKTLKESENPYTPQLLDLMDARTKQIFLGDDVKKVKAKGGGEIFLGDDVKKVKAKGGGKGSMNWIEYLKFLY